MPTQHKGAKSTRSGLQSFGQRNAKKAPPAAEGRDVQTAPAQAEAPKKDDRLVKSVRVTKAQWKRIRDLETERERTFQDLCFDGLNLLFKQHGLGPL